MPVYFVAQVFGILSTATCLIMPLFKKKWQILALAFFGPFACFCTTTFALWKYRMKKAE